MNFAAMLYDGEPQFSAPKVEKPKPKPKPKPDHTEAREIYEKYLVKAAELKKHQDYANMVAMATDGPSQTPVRPLATLGNNGGALLCDCCLKPIILEGGEYHGVYADEAWQRAPEAQKASKWVSWIKGGLVVRILENGTLRIYHGYERNKTDCCSKAELELQAQEFGFKADTSKLNKLFKFLEDEYPDKDPGPIVSDIFKVMFSFNPGYGVNRPPTTPHCDVCDSFGDGACQQDHNPEDV